MIKKSLPFLLLAFTLTVALFSCKKADDKPAAPKASQEYYPLQKGKWVIYDVDSTIWDDVLCIKRFYHYQIRHTVADTFTDDKGRLSYRMETAIRKRVQDDWTQHQSFYVTNTEVTLEMNYDRLTYVKMIYPIVENETWKGNVNILTKDPIYNFYENWDYKYQYVKYPFNTGFKVFDNTVTIEHIDAATSDPELYPEVYASRTRSKEVFASGVGMVFREYYRWTYDPATTRCRKGSGVVMKAVDHN